MDLGKDLGNDVGMAGHIICGMRRRQLICGMRRRQPRSGLPLPRGCLNPSLRRLGEPLTSG
jgi:hypothetical protein